MRSRPSNESGRDWTREQPLANKAVALIFEKESLRTRVSFEVGIAQLGGHPIFLQQETIGMATRESVHDIGQVLSQYAALIVARTFKHQTCIQLAESASVPVINAMTDCCTPARFLPMPFTLQETGEVHARHEDRVRRGREQYGKLLAGAGAEVSA